MNRFSVLGLAGLLLVGGAGVAAAQDAKFGVAIKASTLGYGVDAAVPVGQKINIRGGFNFLGFTHDFEGDDALSIAGKLKLRSAVAQLDWHPSGGSFHLSPGVMFYNGNEVSGVVSAKQGESFNLGDSDEDLYSNSANPVKGNVSVSFPKVAPMIVLGWGNIVPRGNRRWSIPFEIGIVYTRKPTADFSLTGSACSNAAGTANCRDLSTDAGLQADIAEKEDEINEDLKAPILKFYPVISLGFSFKF